MRTDVHGFLSIHWIFTNEIGENIVLGKFRSYSMYIPVDSVLNSVVLDLILVISDLIPVILDIIPVTLDLIPVKLKPKYKVFFRSFHYEIEKISSFWFVVVVKTIQ